MWVSGAWKWTLIKNLKNLEDNGLFFPLSNKSRKKRESEINWIDACFISRKEFEESIERGEFLEYAKVYWLNEYYWTKYCDVIDNWINKWKIVIKELDMLWLEILKEKEKEIVNYLSKFKELKRWENIIFWDYFKTIFLTIPLEIQAERIKSRWAYMSELELKERSKTAILEIEKAKKSCDYFINTWWKSKEEVLCEVIEIIWKV
jgi:guanylate kinase